MGLIIGIAIALAVLGLGALLLKGRSSGMPTQFYGSGSESPAPAARPTPQR